VCKCGHMDVCACALLHILLFAKHSNILNKLSAWSDFFYHFVVLGIRAA